MRTLLLVEILSVGAFVASAAWTLFDNRAPLPSIDVGRLATGNAEEQWMGIYVQQSHVGYAMSRQIPATEGLIYQEQSYMKLNTMGSVQTLVSAGTALVDAQGQLQRFDFLLSSPFRLSGTGEVRGKSLHILLTEGGETKELDFPIQEPPVLNTTLGSVIRGRELSPGQTFTIPYFDLTTLANAPMTITVEAPVVLPNGDSAWWLRSKMASFESRRLVDERGNTLREESGMGISTQSMSKKEAMDIPDADPPDLVALASVPLTGGLPNARNAGMVKVRVSGVEASSFRNEPPMQVVEGDTVRVSIPLLAELGPLPVKGKGDTEATPTLQAGNPEIIEKANEVVGDAPNRLEAVRRLNDFVFNYVKKVPTIGIPNGLEVLHSRQGDCNEHTALFVSLARAAGIPARIAVGLVYSERLGEAFYYHAWPEVRLSEPDGWIPLDPTFGQFPADATHLKIVNGDLDKQVEVMGMMGRIRLSVVESR